MTKSVFDKGFDKKKFLRILQQQMVKKDEALEDERLAVLLKCYKVLMQVWSEICQKYGLETLKKVWKDMCGFQYEDMCGFQCCDEDENEVKFFLNDYLRFQYYDEDDQYYDEDENEVKFFLNDYLRFHYGWGNLVSADVYLKYRDKNLYVVFEEFDEPKNVMDIAELKYQLDHLDELVESLTSHLGTLIKNLPDI